MREYGNVYSRFWTGETGKQLRSDRDAQVVALYLTTAPTSNMIGLYYLPLPTLAHETGISPFEGASKGLRRVTELGFATYDKDSEHVWVPEMLAHQIRGALKPKDNRRVAIVRQALEYRKSTFYKDFWLRYNAEYELGLPAPEGPDGKPLRSPFEAPSKPVTVTGTVNRDSNSVGVALESAGNGLTPPRARDLYHAPPESPAPGPSQPPANQTAASALLESRGPATGSSPASVSSWPSGGGSGGRGAAGEALRPGDLVAFPAFAVRAERAGVSVGLCAELVFAGCDGALVMGWLIKCEREKPENPGGWLRAMVESGKSPPGKDHDEAKAVLRPYYGRAAILGPGTFPLRVVEPEPGINAQRNAALGKLEKEKQA